MSLALLQIDPNAGDLDGNSSLIIEAARVAQKPGADLMATPELALMGYLPRDLLMNRGFVRRGWEELTQIAAKLKDAPRPLFNSAVLSAGGAVRQAHHKSLLPTYER